MKCAKYGKTDHYVMWPTFEKKPEFSTHNAPVPEKNESLVDETNKKSSSFANASFVQDVPLQTLIVKLHGSNGINRNVRLLLDTGSQKSYVLSSLADEISFRKVGEEILVHERFLGVPQNLKNKKFLLMI